MPVIETREELSTRLEAILGDRTDDDALNFIQDITQTYDARKSAPEGMISQADHDKAMQDSDNAWRQRYRNAFLSGSPDPAFGSEQRTSRPDPTSQGGDKNNPKTFEELFN